MVPISGEKNAVYTNLTLDSSLGNLITAEMENK
jgi:hypothetical protein